MGVSNIIHRWVHLKRNYVSLAVGSKQGITQALSFGLHCLLSQPLLVAPRNTTDHSTSFLTYWIMQIVYNRPTILKKDCKSRKNLQGVLLKMFAEKLECKITISDHLLIIFVTVNVTLRMKH